MADKFNWGNLEKQDLVVENIAALAVYQDPNGDAVIRQDGNIFLQEDNVITIPRPFLPKLIAALMRLQSEDTNK
jgi:hypothetical protein